MEEDIILDIQSMEIQIQEEVEVPLINALIAKELVTSLENVRTNHKSLMVEEAREAHSMAEVKEEEMTIIMTMKIIQEQGKVKLLLLGEHLLEKNNHQLEVGMLLEEAILIKSQ